MSIYFYISNKIIKLEVYFMSLKTPMNHSFNIKCPKCEHKFLYNFKLDCTEKLEFK